MPSPLATGTNATWSATPGITGVATAVSATGRPLRAAPAVPPARRRPAAAPPAMAANAAAPARPVPSCARALASPPIALATRCALPAPTTVAATAWRRPGQQLRQRVHPVCATGQRRCDLRGQSLWLQVRAGLSPLRSALCQRHGCQCLRHQLRQVCQHRRGHRRLSERQLRAGLQHRLHRPGRGLRRMRWHADVQPGDLRLFGLWSQLLPAPGRRSLAVV